MVNTRKIINYILGREFIPEIYRHPTKQSGHELQDFREWIRRHRGVKPRTVSERVRIVLTLLPDLGEDPEQYDASLIRNVLLNHVAKHSRKYAKAVVTSMRQYLRFLATTNRCRPGLENAVPSVPEWRLSSLPRYISDDEVNRVVASCNLNTPVGIRNHAILLLLSRLGLRAQDIVNLRIDDIDWHDGSIRVTGKSARTANLPLPQDVGDALLLYIEKARPRATEERVFMCVRAPHRPFAGSGSISSLVFYALKRAGVTSPSNQGAHLLRHSAATSMLRSGAGLDTVGAILRHGSHDTTAIYAKVDVRMLKEITQPWIADA